MEGHNSPSPPLSSSIGYAVTVAILLRDWDNYSLSERVSYHFALTEALSLSVPREATTQGASLHEGTLPQNEASKETNESDGRGQAVCGVSGLLECVPATPSYRLTRRQKRALKSEILNFNTAAENAQRERKMLCHEPHWLPLRLNSATRVYFAYESTRMAFCLDASPTLTSTFGFGSAVQTDADNKLASKVVMCPLDRLIDMARTYLTALIEPMSSTTDVNGMIYRPELMITVLAVYPRSTAGKRTSFLVRDYRVVDKESLDELIRYMEVWALREVESEIARRLSTMGDGLSASYESWTMPLYSSCLRDILEAGDAALSILSSAARPCIVVATDCRSISCETSFDFVTDMDHVDVPVVVLDLSFPGSRSAESNASVNPGFPLQDYKSSQLLNFDPWGASFPLHFSDDSESLFSICNVNGGCFFDSLLLELAAETYAGCVDPESPFVSDHFFAFRRHTIRANAVQWYTLLSLSPLTPTFHTSWGRLAFPHYLSGNAAVKANVLRSLSSGTVKGELSSANVTAGDEIRRSCHSTDEELLKRNQVRAIISTYIINPVPIKGLIIMRVREGYRAKQYGQSTTDPDKVFIQFMLTTDQGAVVHYELSYNATHSEAYVASVKIELSGDSSFVQSVKADFLAHQGGRRPLTMTQHASVRLCKALRWIREEDLLHSRLSPTSLSNQLSSPDTPFMKRVVSLSLQQRLRHFRRTEFDCVCIGKIPSTQDDDFLSEFRDDEDGEQELRITMEEWSTLGLEGGRYVRWMDSQSNKLVFVEVARCLKATQLFTIVIEVPVSCPTGDRLRAAIMLHSKLRSTRGVQVLDKQMGKFLIGRRSDNDHPVSLAQYNFFEDQHNYASWDLVKDPELMPLLIKRRTEIGGFLLLESSDNHATFAKLVPDSRCLDVSRQAGDLVQYRLLVREDKVIVDLHIECEGGAFFPLRYSSTFTRMMKTLKKRDQECGKALKCRTTVLRAVEQEKVEESDLLDAVERLAGYASHYTMKLRFFHIGSGAANSILRDLTVEMLLSQPTGVKIARLHLTSVVTDGRVRTGDWFVVEFDKSTLSFVNLSSDEKADLFVYRELVFFTFGVSDLYSRRDDVADDVSDDDHISEHMCVLDFSDVVEAGHKLNYSASAYGALTVSKESMLQVESFHTEDFAEIMNPLCFIKIARVVIGSGGSRESISKLRNLLGTILHPIVGERYCLHYDSNGEALLSQFAARSFAPACEDFETDDDEEEGEKNEDPLDAMPVLEFIPQSVRPAPIFVLFHLDDEPTTLQDLDNIEKSVTLTALISVYRGGRREQYPHVVAGSSLPPSHMNAAAEIDGLLNAYVAEQSLERLRHIGQDIGADELRIVIASLRKARNVAMSNIDVFFYAGRSDSMVPASAPAGSGPEVEEGFSLLASELRKCEIPMKEYRSDGFVVTESEPGKGSLAYWCFILIQRSLGSISIQVHHPAGLMRGSEYLAIIHDMVSERCHKVNQLLLLRRMHQSRTACPLMIASESHMTTQPKLFNDGLFSCPIVYKTSFPLFHRCNPAQVARSLEETVLHVFAVSNRRNLFVYKDEIGSIFYMSLSTSSGGGAEVDGAIDLLVHGVGQPGPSVTLQLRRLLQKRLLSLAVEALSTVLVKNPQYYWRPADLEFVRGFDQEWRMLEDVLTTLPYSSRWYSSPSPASDLGLILLYFRQNLCGSTFFHHLLVADSGSGQMDIFETNKVLDLSRLRFYYNNSISQLDPKIQGQSTLTEKGAAHASKTGTGIAIIELGVIDPNGEELSQIKFGLSTEPEVTSDLPVKSLYFTRMSDANKSELANGNASMYVLKVSITGTGLNIEELHEWVLLTLNQVLMSWFIERQLERMQRGLLSLKDATADGFYKSGKDKMELVGKISPGLPKLIAMLESTYELPHPAVLKYTSSGILRASSLASFCFDLIERTIMDHLHIPSDNATVLRLSRWDRPVRVQLAYNSTTTEVIVRHYGTSAVIQDSPIECPEYLVFYQFPDYLGSKISPVAPPPKLFEGVSIDLVGAVDGTRPALAQDVAQDVVYVRSFAFVMSVKRNRRTLLTYNWSPQLFKRAKALLQAKEKGALAATRHVVEVQQRRSLRELSPLPESTSRDAPFRVQEKAYKAAQKEQPDTLSARERDQAGAESSGELRRSARPVGIGIRRPKLIGASVDGAAIHAVAASRARASANIFKANLPSLPHRKQNDDTLHSRVPSAAPATNSSNPSSRSISNGSEERYTSVKLDHALSRAKLTLANMIRDGSEKLQRRHLRATHSLTQSWYLTLTSSRPSSALSNFILSQGSMAWMESVSLLPFPREIILSFQKSFAKQVGEMIPGFRVIPYSGKNDESSTGSVLLVGEVKKVRSCKCFPALQISIVNSKLSNLVLSCVGWVVTIPRQTDSGKLSSPFIAANVKLLESDSVGIDKLGSDIHREVQLDILVFDFALFTVDHYLQGTGGERCRDDSMTAVKMLAGCFSLTKQLSFQSSYKCFEVSIELSSYENELIDMFDGPELFGWLHKNFESRKLLKCGPEGLLLHNVIEMVGTSSLVLLSKVVSSRKKLMLYVLCRANGRDLRCICPRDGSFRAGSLVSNIAIEAAGLVFEELRNAAICLRRDALWTDLSTSCSAQDAEPEEVLELIQLCEVTSVSDYVQSAEVMNRISLVCSDESHDWRRCLELLQGDGSFSPSYHVLGLPFPPSSKLFYYRPCDHFFILAVGPSDQVQILLVEREKSATRVSIDQAISALINYMLHVMWSGL